MSKFNKFVEVSDVNNWVQITLLGVDSVHHNYTRLLLDSIFTSYKSVIWKSRLAMSEKICDINIEKYFYNTVKRKLNFFMNVSNGKKS